MAANALDEGVEDEITRAQLVMARRFIGQRCILDPQLISPLRVIWLGYKGWATPLGITPSAVALRALLDASPWATVEERSSVGRIKTVVHGVGIKR